MFRRLRLSLAMVNLSVIVVIFLLLTTGTYVFVQDRLVKGAEFMMSRLARDLASGQAGDLPPLGRPWPLRVAGRPGSPPPMPVPGPITVFGQLGEASPRQGPEPVTFFVKLDPAGKVAATSELIPLSRAQLSALARQVRSSGKRGGTLTLDQNEYLYHAAPISGDQGEVIVLQDFHRERGLLRLLVTAVSAAGLICVVLSLFGSFFMADKAMIPIQKAWQQQKEFLADASHELRTPLSVIQTNLEIVRDNPSKTVRSQNRWLNNIYEEMTGMTKLVESLLFLAQADSHLQLLTRDWLSLSKAVAVAADAFRPVAAAQGISLDLRAETEVGYYGDEARLRQVVGILLDNAIRHTPSGGEIAVHLERSHHGMVLSVADTGEGISPEHIEKIFDRFYQADPARSHGGTGLGLAIAKWIVGNHGGTIAVASTVGEGTTFTVRLPLVSA